MNSEERKEYNKKYYSERKALIQEKLSTKEQCSYCGRNVCHQNIPKHWKSKLCMSRREQHTIAMLLQNKINEIVKQ